MTRGGIPGGAEPDPGKGVPYLNARDKARLLLSGATEQQVREIMLTLIDLWPDRVLEGFCSLLEEEEEGLILFRGEEDAPHRAVLSIRHARHCEICDKPVKRIGSSAEWAHAPRQEESP